LADTIVPIMAKVVEVSLDHVKPHLADEKLKSGKNEISVVLSNDTNEKLRAEIPKSTFEKAWWPSKILFLWISPIMWKGYRGQLTEDDLEYNKADAAEDNANKMESAWAEQMKTPNPSLRRAMTDTFGRDMLKAAGWMLAWSCLVILACFYFVRRLFVFVRETANNSPLPMYEGWLYACFFWVCCWLLCVCLQQMSARAVQTGIQVRGALMTLVYRKSLRIANVGSEIGDVVSLVSNDCARLMEGVTFFQYLWSGPVVAIAIVVCMITLIGYKALPAVGVIAVLFTIQFTLGAKVVKNRAKGIATTDARVQTVTEALLAIKVVKMYAWEKQFADMVALVRDREIKILRTSGLYKTINILSVFGTPPTIATTVFATWVFSDGGSNFNGEIVFTMLTMFNTLRLPMSFLPKAIKGLAESLAALNRIQNFLARPEVAPLPDRGRIGITMSACDFSYGAPEPVLTNITMDLKRGQLLGLVGAVGCGKSTLLMGILTECRLLKGDMSVGGSIAYVPQVAWIQHGTVRDNILFGKPLDDYKYRRTIFACALERDMEILSHGDMTEIGERGINLSGGQRQRIALARAVYSEADIMLLDNPLSAVDQHTCRHIFDYCIQDMLVAAGKTVILVTHQLELLPSCDLVCIMEDNKFFYYGPYDYDLIANKFPQWAASNDKDAVEKALSMAGAEKAGRVAKPKDHVPGLKVNKEGGSSNNKMVQEDEASGRLGFFEAFFLWCKQANYWRAALSLLIFALAQLTRTSGDYWLTIWVAADSNNPNNKIPLDPEYKLNYNNISKPLFMGIYAMFLVLFWSMMFLRGWWFYKCVLLAATRLHDRMFRKVLRAPMGFFNKTPTGRLINSVSKDMDTVDESLPDTVHLTLIYMFILLVTLFFVTGVLYYFAIVAALLIIGFFAINAFYIKTTRVLKKATGNSASPIFAHLAETLSGIAVIRAFRTQKQFRSDNLSRVDRNNRAVFSLEMAQLYAAHRLDWLGSLLLFAVAAFAVALNPNQTGFTAGAFGFAVSNAFQMLLFFTAFVRGVADIESMLGAVERVDYYAANIPEEAALVIEGRRPPQGWPKTGNFTFKDVVMRYDAKMDPALREVTFDVKDKEKIGIVGRTGSGKSTTLLALFRLYESDKGAIVIDNEDVSAYGLHDVRSRLGILPQEPVMFKGTVRTNLDPFNENSDMDLWSALEKSYLKNAISSMPNRLETPVEEGGANFSLGQRQLFCLARAILKKSRLLFLDEATAAMDLETDALIQAAIKREFADSTVCTIAHRLDTIITSDRILVMDQGKVVEFDSPVTLLCNPQSSFSKLVKQVGPAAEAALKHMAFEHFLEEGKITRDQFEELIQRELGMTPEQAAASAKDKSIFAH